MRITFITALLIPFWFFNPLIKSRTSSAGSNERSAIVKVRPANLHRSPPGSTRDLSVPSIRSAVSMACSIGIWWQSEEAEILKSRNQALVEQFRSPWSSEILKVCSASE